MVVRHCCPPLSDVRDTDVRHTNDEKFTDSVRTIRAGRRIGPHSGPYEGMRICRMNHRGAEAAKDATRGGLRAGHQARGPEDGPADPAAAPGAVGPGRPGVDDRPAPR